MLSVVDDGVLKGYVPIHKDWTGFSGDIVRKAAESVFSGGQTDPEDSSRFVTVQPLGSQWNLEGFREISGQAFHHRDKPYLRIRNGRLCFSRYCLQMFRDVEYVELLLNPIHGCIAIRPADQENPNAIHWGKLKDGRWATLPMGCPGLLHVLGDLMEWEESDALSFIGEFCEEQKLLLFSLGDSAVKRTIVPEEPDEQALNDNAEDSAGTTQNKGAAGEKAPALKTVMVYSPGAIAALDIPFTSVATVSLLEQRHIALDVPTYFVGDGKTTEKLPYNTLMQLPQHGIICIDTGCGKGGKLTAMIVKDGQYCLEYAG